MDNPGVQSSDLPHSLHLDSLSGVAEDASTLAAAQAQHQHDIQEHVPSAEPTDAQSLHPLQTAVGTLDSYSIQQQEEQNEARSFREPFNNLPGGYLRDMPSVVDPPDLDLWRERLFNVDETIVLSEEQFLTYFPHVDNIYSHRSTQHYKRKPLISHYWDCRLKGRPPGTPKSDDPNKKKRKRTARQRDLCDVKIKITEYFPGYSPMMIAEGAANDAGAALGAESLSSGEAVFPPPEDPEPRDRQPFGVLTPNPPLPEGHPGANGQRFFTIQRVNGNGANGKNDGVSGGHRHTLEESDRVKKNSVQRYLLKEAREKKKASSINRKIVPNFYRVLQEQDQQKQISNAQELKDAFTTLVNAADTQGPFFLGANMSFVDVQVAPWIIRLHRVLKPYRGWPDPDAGSRWGAWVNAIEVNEHVKATTSDDELYFDSYERYARKFP
ncbi:hypothetical protein APSETT445_002597 [Aspergillus pseudonomiae]